MLISLIIFLSISTILFMCSFIILFINKHKKNPNFKLESNNKSFIKFMPIALFCSGLLVLFVGLATYI